MIPNYDRDLVIAVSGTGEWNENNVESNMMDFMLGSAETREVTLVVPLFSKMSANMKNFIHWAIPYGFDFIFVQSENSPMTKEISALSKNPDNVFLRVNTDRDVVNQMITCLQVAHDAGDDVCFSMFYDPTSVYLDGTNPPSDFDIVGTAKMKDWLFTANICEGMQDSFEGYESAEEKKIREEAEAKYAAEQAQESPQKPRRAPRKAASKKTAAAPKKTAPSSTPGLDKLIRNAVQNDKAHEHFFQWVDNGEDISGSFCIRCGMSEDEFHEKHEVVKSYAEKDVEATLSLQQEMAKSAPSPWDKQDRYKENLKKLTGHIQELANAFNNITTTLMEMIDDID